jgi:Ca2+-binding RTX toxin-like protein
VATIRGTDKANKLKGKAADDRIYGLLGSDKIDGGAGDDILHGHGGNDKLIGGLGNDWLAGGDGADNLTGGDGDDNLDGGDDIFADILRGGAGNDFVSDYGGNNRLYGDSGNDTLDAGSGADKLTGGDGNDFLSGGAGNDSLLGNAGNDALHGEDGLDKLSGGLGNDYLDGGNDEVKDVLNAGAGNDRVAAREFDIAIGGAGIDTLVFTKTFQVTPNTEPVPVVVNLSKITGRKAADVGLGLKASQFEKAELYVYGAVKGSTIIGSKGDDALTVYTSDGGVTVNGGKGDDVISSDGENVLIGGSGSDTFVLHSHNSADIIQDFTAKDFLLIDSYFYPSFDGSTGSNNDLLNPLVIGSAPLANSTKAQFLYDTDDGRLLFDRNGSEIGGEMHIATLATRPALKLSSFIFDF